MSFNVAKPHAHRVNVAIAHRATLLLKHHHAPFAIASAGRFCPTLGSAGSDACGSFCGSARGPGSVGCPTSPAILGAAGPSDRGDQLSTLESAPAHNASRIDRATGLVVRSFSKMPTAQPASSQVSAALPNHLIHPYSSSCFLPFYNILAWEEPVLHLDFDTLLQFRCRQLEDCSSWMDANRGN